MLASLEVKSLAISKMYLFSIEILEQQMEILTEKLQMSIGTNEIA
jgi:hypothetical protein